MIRYADDFIVLCQKPEEAQNALNVVQAWADGAGLTLHPEKTRIVDLWDEGFDFLGYHFWKHTRWPRKKSLNKLKDTIRQKTRRTNGHSLQHIIASINPILRGWFAYFKHSNARTFRSIDQWLRMRLRSILRKRSNRSGRGRGRDHNRWTNAFFTEQGLFSSTAAFVSAHQSATR